VNEVVSALPKSAPAVPEAEVGPVLVMPSPARTTNELVVPSSTRDSEAELPVERLVEIATRNNTAATEKATKCFVILKDLFVIFGVLNWNSPVVSMPPEVEWPSSRLHLDDYKAEFQAELSHQRLKKS
jgi:hypothetical protein